MHSDMNMEGQSKFLQWLLKIGLAFGVGRGR